MNNARGDAKSTFASLTGDPLLAEAINNAMESRRERLNEAVKVFDNELGDADPRVVAAAGRFIDAMWAQF